MDPISSAVVLSNKDVQHAYAGVQYTPLPEDPQDHSVPLVKDDVVHYVGRLPKLQMLAYAGIRSSEREGESLWGKFLITLIGIPDQPSCSWSLHRE